MKVLVLGGAGELGANFGKLCTDMEHEVTLLDLTRFYEAWRLKELDIQDKVTYIWKSTFDLTGKDLQGYDLILDCACQADRPSLPHQGHDNPHGLLLWPHDADGSVHRTMHNQMFAESRCNC